MGLHIRQDIFWKEEERNLERNFLKSMYHNYQRTLASRQLQGRTGV